MTLPVIANFKHVTTLMLLLVVPLAGGLVFVWKLHTPTPRTRTSVVLNRNSLLAHRFAGPCLNCHQIQDVGPVRMNAENMHLFNLTRQQRHLLLAGQRVEEPTVMQRLRMPAINRDDVLPHPFVGVCSNCHLVLDIRPSDEWFRGAMRMAYQPLAAAPATEDWISHGGVLESERRELWRNVWGFVALVCFLLGAVYIVMRGLLRRDAKAWKGKLQIKKWFTVHEWASVGACLAAILHWHYSDRGNNFLHLALVIIVWLTAAGYILRYKFAAKESRKKVQFLHSQRFLYVALIVLLVVGHFFVDFE